MNRVITKILFSVLQIALFITLAHADQVEFSSSLNPVGSGARATGMGGAFIGVADDATAASWNPAGLIQLEKPEMSLVYASQRRGQTYHSTIHPEMNGTNDTNTDGINYMSYAYPFTALGRNMIVSLNYQQLYEMKKKVNMNYRWDLGGGDYRNDVVAFHQSGYLYALSPAVAVQVKPSISIGATLNFWTGILGQNGWANAYRSTSLGSVLGNSVTEQFVLKDANRFKGFNANLGALWNITDAFALGAVYKTAFTGKIKQDKYLYWNQVFGGTTSLHLPEETSSDLTMRMPSSFGLGLQYRSSDRLLFAMDIYQTKWSRFFIKDAAGNEFNPISSKALSEGRLKDTTQLRLGTEYLFIGNNRTIALRAGIFSDPEPTTGSVDKYAGISLGTGYSTGKYALDASYQVRKGTNVDGDIASIDPKSTDVTQHTVMVSGIYYF